MDASAQIAVACHHRRRNSLAQIDPRGRLGTANAVADLADAAATTQTEREGGRTLASLEASIVAMPSASGDFEGAKCTAPSTTPLRDRVPLCGTLSNRRPLAVCTRQYNTRRFPYLLARNGSTGRCRCSGDSAPTANGYTQGESRSSVKAQTHIHRG